MPHSHSHQHHGHSHDVTTPHPAQAASLSILRMTLPARLGAALLVCAVLWAMVWVVMR